MAAIAFLIARARQRERDFNLLDSLLLVILMSIVTVGGVVLVEAASRGAKEMALSENLRLFRMQIEAYKLQHGGQLPLLYEGSFPQLTDATNYEGQPGKPGNRHPFGPYLTEGIPVNPITGRSYVSQTEKTPPEAPSGNGGWLYNQQTGQISVDLPEFLNR